MSIQLTFLDRGLGFRVDTEPEISDCNMLAVLDQVGDSTIHRFRYGLCNFTGLTDVRVEAEGISAVMRRFLKIVENHPDLLLGVAGPSEAIDSLQKYVPFFDALPWNMERCPNIRDAMDWVSGEMRETYGVIPDFVRTIPLGHSVGGSVN